MSELALFVIPQLDSDPVVTHLDPVRRRGGIQRYRNHSIELDTAVKPRYDSLRRAITVCSAVRQIVRRYGNFKPWHEIRRLDWLNSG